VNGCETDTLSDPRHCGACGHDCLGGACEDGGCQPIQIADGQSNPFGITVDATTGRVYWTNSTSGEVASVRIDGSGYDLHASGQATPQAVRYHDGHLYWANAGEAGVGCIMKLDMANASASPEVFVDDQKNPMDIVFAFGRMYWTNNTADGAVMSVPVAGGGPEVALGNLNRPGALIADDSAVYAAVVLGRRLVGIDPSHELQMDQQLDDMPAGLATDLLDVYWTTLSGNVRKRSKLPNSPVIDVATSSGLLTGIVLDSSHVFFADTSHGMIYRVAKSGGSKTPVAVGQQSPFNMAGDADSVYWTNRVSNGGSIMRLAK
jgi:outer membrane protein assembly factor BamB